jgi:hypothetical protein
MHKVNIEISFLYKLELNELVADLVQLEENMVKYFHYD